MAQQLEFKKMTILQLKALCKERKIAGYSKLNKAGLVERLEAQVANAGRSNQDTGDQTSTGQQTAQNKTPKDGKASPGVTSASGPTSTTPPPTASVGLPHIREALKSPPHLVETHQPLARTKPSPTGSLVEGVGPQDPVRLSQEPTQVLPLARESHALDPTQRASSTLISSRKRPRPESNNGMKPKSGLFKVPALPQTSTVEQEPRLDSRISGTPAQERLGDNHNPNKRPRISTEAGKRFKPLRPARKLPSESSTQTGPDRTVTNFGISSCDVFDPHLCGLDFPALSAPTSFKAISLPPSVAQRKRVASLALALSDIDIGTLKSCTQVSRLFRYAAYASAFYQLARRFSGLRLDKLLDHVSPNMTNLWPYLQFREREVIERKTAYENSFLGHALKHISLVSRRLWGSPDHEKQITVAVRFILTRFCESLLAHSAIRQHGWATSLVVDAQNIIDDEIWCIDILHSDSGRLERLYVLEKTCEIIGRPEDSLSSGRTTPIRTDWSNLLTPRLSQTSGKLGHSDSKPLLDSLSWTNHEEYQKGMSKLWLSKISSEDDLGKAKLLVAERYILACIVGNSVSGRWMSSTEMDQEYSGIPCQVQGPKPKVTKVNLYLPPHHHIESIHFTTAQKKPTHPAIAVVQTPAREYYILRDNGFQIGCEEEGIEETWMNILGCSSVGLLT